MGPCEQHNLFHYIFSGLINYHYNLRNPILDKIFSSACKFVSLSVCHALDKNPEWNGYFGAKLLENA